MKKEIRFAVTDEEFETVKEYVSKKHRWKKMSDFARYAVFKEMDANKAGSHRSNGARPSPLDSQPNSGDS